jgi:spore coat polysaccharide biosynthesis protein SpsF
MNTLVFRCDASPKIGFGHVVRCLALADELRGTHGCTVAFALREGQLGCAMVQEKGYHVFTGEIKDYDRWIADILGAFHANALVLDVRDDLSPTVIRALRREGILIVDLDDPSERRLEADLAFYPPVPQVQKMDWTGFTGRLYTGWEWVVLRQEFSHPADSEGNPGNRQTESPIILVTMGGSDPAGLTLKAAKALNLVKSACAAVVVCGPGFARLAEIERLLAKIQREVSIQQNVHDIWGLMRQTELAIASFGVTAYELAAVGVPAIHLCLSEEHAESASAFVRCGMAVSLGRHDQVSEADLAGAVDGLLQEPSRLKDMSAHARRTVDGRGAERIARLIMERIGHGCS